MVNLFLLFMSVAFSVVPGDIMKTKETMQTAEYRKKLVQVLQPENSSGRVVVRVLQGSNRGKIVKIKESDLSLVERTEATDRLVQGIDRLGWPIGTTIVKILGMDASGSMRAVDREAEVMTGLNAFGQQKVRFLDTKQTTTVHRSQLVFSRVKEAESQSSSSRGPFISPTANYFGSESPFDSFFGSATASESDPFQTFRGSRPNFAGYPSFASHEQTMREQDEWMERFTREQEQRERELTERREQNAREQDEWMARRTREQDELMARITREQDERMARLTREQEQREREQDELIARITREQDEQMARLTREQEQRQREQDELVARITREREERMEQILQQGRERPIYYPSPQASVQHDANDLAAIDPATEITNPSSFLDLVSWSERDGEVVHVVANDFVPGQFWAFAAEELDHLYRSLHPQVPYNRAALPPRNQIQRRTIRVQPSEEIESPLEQSD